MPFLKRRLHRRYCRPFLRGSEGAWIDGVRLRDDAALYRCYEVLAQGWRDQGQHRIAIAIAERAIALDPLRETGYRLLMEAELAHDDSIEVAERARRL